MNESSDPETEDHQPEQQEEPGDETLILSVCMYPALYDKDNPLYLHAWKKTQMWHAISAETGIAGKEIKLHCHYLIIVIAAMSRRETYNIRSCVGDNVIPSKLASTHISKTHPVLSMIVLLMTPEHTNSNEVKTFIFNTADVSQQMINSHQCICTVCSRRLTQDNTSCRHRIFDQIFVATIHIV